MPCVSTLHLICVQVGFTGCYYNNDRLTTNEGKNPIILGPAIVQFEKDAFLFSRFASEMPTHQPAVSNLKAIGTDL